MSDEGTSDGVPEEELLAELSMSSEGAGSLQELSARVDELESAVGDRLDGVEVEFWELVEDVRNRVIQVKRETDQKAPADHDHARLDASIERLSDDVDESVSELAELDRRVDAGFENFEDVLEYVLETTDELEEKAGRLAGAVVRLRERLDDLTDERAGQKALDSLLESANRHGIRRAACEGCGESVRLGLLRRPECPHCGARFARLEPSGRVFFGSNTLRTGRPALMGEVADREEPVVDKEGTSSSITGAVELTDIEGVGLAYASRLREAGVETPDELARSNPEALARAVDVSPKRVADWVDRAAKLADRT